MTETTTKVEKPIVVNSSALPANLLTLLRYFLVASGGVLVTRGYLDDKTMNDIVGILMMLIPTLYGIYATQRSNDIKVTLADRVSDRTAIVK